MEPSKFFIGVIDLFAVLLPGAIVTFLVQTLLVALGDLPGSPAVSVLMGALHGHVGWVAFFIASYLLGHFIFSLSSRLDVLYDEIRQREPPTQLFQVVARLCDKQQRAVETALVGIEGLTRNDSQRGLGWLRPVRFLALGGAPLGAGRGASESAVATNQSEAPKRTLWIGTYKTALAVLQLSCPGALVEVRRLEADSKFFRSAVMLFVVILAILVGLIGRAACMSVTHDRGPAAAKLGSDVAAALLSLWFLRLSFARYCEQRTKAIDLAYQLMVTQVALGGSTAAPTTAVAED